MRRVVRHCTFGLGALLMAVQAPAQSPTTVKQMLEAFAADYRLDPMAMSAEFGIKVGEQWWSVSVVRRQEAYANGRLTGHRSGPHEVILREGAPSRPTWQPGGCRWMARRRRYHRYRWASSRCWLHDRSTMALALWAVGSVGAT